MGLDQDVFRAVDLWSRDFAQLILVWRGVFRDINGEHDALQ